MGYYILYGFLWVGGLLPLRILYFFSDIYFYLIYYLLKYRRRVVRANLQHAFPEKDLSEIIKIEKRYYRHLCDFFVEMYKMWHMSDEQIRRRCKFTNPEVIRRYFDQGKSVMGYWGITAIGNGCLPIAFGCPGNSTSLPYINLCIMR